MNTVAIPVAANPFTARDDGHEAWSFTIEGRTVWLYKRRYPDGSRSGAWYCKFQVAGQKMVNQSTDATTKERAKEIARLKFLAAWEGRLEALRGSTLRQVEVTIGEVLAIYRAGIAARSEGIQQRTIVSNISALRSMVRVVKGDAVAQEMEGLSCRVLDRIFAIDYKERALAGSQAENPKTSANSTMAQARSIFSKEALELYRDRGLEVPENVREWLAVPRFSAKEEDLSFEPIPQAILEAMDREIVQEAPAVRAIYTMARWLGMRAGEIAEARWEWLEQWPEGCRMVIKRRSYWKGPKKLRAGMVGVRDEVRAVLEACGAKDSLWIIGGAHATERTRDLLDQANAFLRRFLPDREKGLHELRKQLTSAGLSPSTTT